MKITSKRVKGTQLESEIKIELSQKESEKFDSPQTIYLVCETDAPEKNISKKIYTTTMYKGKYIDDFTDFDDLMIIYQVKIQEILESEDSSYLLDEFDFILDEVLETVGYDVEFKVLHRFGIKHEIDEKKDNIYKFQVVSFKEAIPKFIRALVHDKMFSEKQHIPKRSSDEGSQIGDALFNMLWNKIIDNNMGFYKTKEGLEFFYDAYGDDRIVISCGRYTITDKDFRKVYDMILDDDLEKINTVRGSEYILPILDEKMA